MSDLRKAAEMALETLERLDKWLALRYGNELTPPEREVVKALRQALAQPEQEPVAWMHPKGEPQPVGYIDGIYGGYMVFTPLNPAAVYLNGTALYPAPPKREWVGLTDVDKVNLCGMIFGGRFLECIDAVEAKLKEKNCG